MLPCGQEEERANGFVECEVQITGIFRNSHDLVVPLARFIISKELPDRIFVFEKLPCERLIDDRYMA
jgi:hypothetical protein